MDTELKCNRLTCRRALVDKAVVTTCSHIFCVDCANELFNASRLCPACETPLTEPDDVVVSSLHPSNDYKTSVLSGLSPSIILEICSRAISFWQYQVHQENSFQQAVLRNVNDKNAQLQKQLDNVVREELERDLEIERRKIRDLQEASRERDKEYQKLKNQYDRIKRKALLAPSNAHDIANGMSAAGNVAIDRRGSDEHGNRHRVAMPFGASTGGNVNIGAVVGGMEASGVQRTPIVNRTMGGSAPSAQQSMWQQQPAYSRMNAQRVPFAPGERSMAASISDRSDSGNEVENMVLGNSYRPNPRTSAARTAPQKNRSHQRVVAPPTGKRAAGGFRPAGLTTGR